MLTIDVETSYEGEPSLEWWKSNLDSLAYKVDDKEIQYLENFKEENLNEFKKEFEKSDILIGHGIKFDLLVLRKNGMFHSPGVRILDTTILSSLYDNRGSKKLKDLGETILGAKVIRLDDLLLNSEGKKISLKDVPSEKRREYNVQDVDLTYRLYKYFTDPSRLEERIKTRYIFEEKLLKILVDTEWDGIKIDLNKIGNLISEFRERIASFELGLKSSLKEVDWNSPKQLSDYFFKDKKPLKKTEKGNPSVDEEVLKELAEENSDADLILKVRKYSKLINTYLMNYINHSYENKVHPTFIQHKDLDEGANTSRLSSSRPNVQNIPEHSEGRIVKSVFVADQGHTFIGADFSQIELRFLAHFSSDPILVKAFKDGLDMHSNEAKEIFEVSVPTKAQRFIGKTFNFALGFGAGYSSLSAALKKGLPPEEYNRYTYPYIMSLINKYWARHKTLLEWSNKVKEMVKKTGYIDTILGRRVYFDNANEEYVQRSAVNAIPQGSAADLMKLSVIKLKESGVLVSFKNFIHDEIIVQVKKEHAENIAFKIKKIMIGSMKLNVPIRVSIKIATNFSELK